MLWLQLALALAALGRVGGSSFLFDLNTDPTEAVNLDPAMNEEMYERLVTRSAYWAAQVREADPGDLSDKKVVWKEKQGVVSWATNTDFVPPEVPVKYSHAGAPHIVFVLVDDWGINDPGWKSSYLSWTTPNIDRLAAEGIKLDNYYSAYYWCVRRQAPSFLPSLPLAVPLVHLSTHAEPLHTQQHPRAGVAPHRPVRHPPRHVGQQLRKQRTPAARTGPRRNHHRPGPSLSRPYLRPHLRPL
jgi:hypothetical protein